MGRGTPWPKDREDLLHKCIYEKNMPVPDCARTLGVTEASIRSKIRQKNWRTNPPIPFPAPNMKFFENYGTDDTAEPREI